MSLISQIDHYQHDVGKNNPESKREVVFLFEVDGEKYEVLLKWSFTSGKYSIFVNDDEVFFGTKKGASLMDQKFQFRDLDFHLVGTRSIPKGAYPGSYNDFELLINGILFSSAPRRGENQARPMEGTESILDLLYPKLRMAAYEEQCRRTQEPVDVAPTPPPAPAPVADLLSFNAPTAPDVRGCSSEQAVATANTAYTQTAQPEAADAAMIGLFSTVQVSAPAAPAPAAPAPAAPAPAAPAPAAPGYTHTASTAVPDAMMNGLFYTVQAPTPASTAPMYSKNVPHCPAPSVYNNTAPPLYNNNYAAPQGHNPYPHQSHVAPVITPANPFDALPQNSSQPLNTFLAPLQVGGSNPYNDPRQQSYSAQPPATVSSTAPAENPPTSSSSAYTSNPCATATATSSPWGAPAPVTTSPLPAPMPSQSTPVDPFGGVF